MTIDGAPAANRSANTIRNYASQWRVWTIWCAQRGVAPMPAQTEDVTVWLFERYASGARMSTLGVGIAAIEAAHRDAGLDPVAPVGSRIRSALAEMRRESRDTPRRVAPLVADDLEQVLSTCEGTGRDGARDRALLLVLRDGLLRRSEAAALNWADISTAADGTGRLTIRASTVDPDEDAVLWLSPRTMEALAAWSRPTARRPDAPVFVGLGGPARKSRLSGRAVAGVVQRRCAEAGLEGQFGGHSLRRGSALMRGDARASLSEIMAAGRWKSPKMVEIYAAGVEPDRFNGAGVGL